MAGAKPAKVVLFDIGGVVVLSPMQAIDEYEKQNGLPSNWINFAISYAAPDGHWQKLERGEVKLDEHFFKGFAADLQSPAAWQEFHARFRNEKKKLKSLANPTQLGDHVSLKAETAPSNPTAEDQGVSSSTGSRDPPKPALSKLAKDTTIGDPVSLESEEVVEPPPESNHYGPTASGSSSVKSPQGSEDGPPSVNGEDLFWKMMSISRHPDPYIFPALERLLQVQPRPIIAALSNTVVWPPGHPWNKAAKSVPDHTAPLSERLFADPGSVFDVYVSSSAVGMRKPSPDIYEYTVQQLNEYATKAGLGTIRADDIVFLDDIGGNLKAATGLGMRTIKVQMGRTWRAVKMLEAELGGVELLDDKTRRSKL